MAERSTGSKVLAAASAVVIAGVGCAVTVKAVQEVAKVVDSPKQGQQQ